MHTALSRFLFHLSNDIVYVINQTPLAVSDYIVVIESLVASASEKDARVMFSSVDTVRFYTFDIYQFYLEIYRFGLSS